MFKTVIAGVTALSLTFASATPTQANGLSQDDIGKLLFGLVAAATLGAAIKNSDRRRERTQQHAPQVQRQQHQPVISHRSQRRLPAQCLRNVETRFGEHRLFGKRCLERNFRHAANLPQQCAVRVFTNRGPRNGFDPHCLRDEGYRTRRNR